MALMSSIDVLRINNSEELVGLIDDVVKEIPEIQFFAASPVRKNTYKTLAMSGLPSTAFRAPGEVREFQTATLANHTVECKYLDASWILEKAVAQQSDWGEDFAKALTQRAHLRSEFLTLARQIWHGVDSDAGGFVGVDAFIDAVVDSSGNGEMTVVANAAEDVEDASTVYAVRTGLDSCQLVWGSGGAFNESDVREQLIASYDADAGEAAGAWYYAQDLGGWVGLQASSRYAAGKITGLSATGSNTGLTDDLLYELLERFPAGMKPDGLFMSRRSFSQLRQSRTAYSPIGAPAPYAYEFEGVKIYVTDAITDAVPAAA